jgi:RimJ/RimL family protein N-acetyltransferase
MLGEWLQRPHIAGWWGACRSVCLGQGLGTAMVGEFVQFLWRDPAVTRIQADPAPTNARAIRCYEKAGFHSLGLITTPDGPALLMLLDRPLPIGRGESAAARGSS